VSGSWRSLDAVWLAHEQGLRRELPKATVDRMLTDVVDIGAGLDNGQPWFVVAAR